MDGPGQRYVSARVVADRNHRCCGIARRLRRPRSRESGHGRAKASRQREAQQEVLGHRLAAGNRSPGGHDAPHQRRAGVLSRTAHAARNGARVKDGRATHRA
jgi:hypothetical protein